MLRLTHTDDEGNGSRALVGDEEKERAVDADLDRGHLPISHTSSDQARGGSPLDAGLVHP